MYAITIESLQSEDLDAKTLKDLVYDAAKKTLEYLQHVAVPIKPKRVFRVKHESTTVYNAPLPYYRDSSIYDQIFKVWGHDETFALMDYICDKKSFRSSIEKADTDERRAKKLLYEDLVAGTLYTVLEKTEIQDFIEEKEIKDWSLNDKDLIKEINNYIEYIMEIKKEVYTYTAICPLPFFNTSLIDDNISIAEGITIKYCSSLEQSMYHTFHEHEYFWDDAKSPSRHDYVVEIKVTRNKNDKENIRDLITKRLNLLKWGFMVATDSNKAVSEGTCLIFDRIGTRIAKFRREDDYDFSHTSASFKQIQICKQALIDISDYSEHFNQPLWHLGRSCVSNLDRDILLEAAFGLDGLLVPGGGDSRYRFCVHGASVLQNASDDKMYNYDLLKTIYRIRSTGAHGNKPSKAKDLGDYAPLARKLLTNAIFESVQLAKNGIIDLEKDKDVAKAIENFVIKKVVN